MKTDGMMLAVLALWAGCGGLEAADVRAGRGPDATSTGTTATSGQSEHDDHAAGRTPGGGDDDDTATTPTEWTTPPTETLAGVPIPPPLPAAALTRIGNQIDAVLARTSATVGVLVVDLENGQQVYAREPDLPLKPASNTKLFTTAVAMQSLGADHRFSVDVYADAAPDPSGAVRTLDVVAGHDFTWSTRFYPSEFFAAERLADALYDAGLRRVTGQLTLRGEVAVEPYHYGYLDVGEQRDTALDVLALALEERGIALDGALAVGESFAPGAHLLTTRASPPLAVSCHPLNVYSNNEMADMLGRHNGWQLWGESSYAAGEAAALDWLAGFGIDTGAIELNDGSGLSHDNRVTARAVIGLLSTMAAMPEGEDFRRTLSVGGVIGTLGGRLTGDDTWGRVHGKTGTLTGVSALSGTLFHRYDGHRYLFSILMNHTESATFARSLQDDIVRALAVDHRGAGQRPDQPVLAAVRNLGDGAIEVSWQSAPGAVDYTVWISLDGAWHRDDARLATGTSLVVSDLPLGRTVLVKVTAQSPAGVSDPSDVYATRTATAPSEVLVVDANDRYTWQFENPLGIGHELVALHGLALGERTFDSVANEQVVAGVVELADYRAVSWVLGEESTEHATFDAAERQVVEDYLGAGGGLLVSGAEIGWDLDAMGTEATRAFYGEALHADYAGDDAGTAAVVPVAGGLFAGLGELDFLVPGLLEVRYPDVLLPVGGARAELTYVGGVGGVAAVSYAGDHRVVNLGFPIETIDNRGQREAVVQRAMAFLAP